MGRADDTDGLDTPGWMHVVADSDLTGRVLAKARMDCERLRDARASTDPRAMVFINGMREVAYRGRERWQPGLDRQWWTTAWRDSALAAYVAALEFSEVDDEAAACARQLQAWFMTRSE